jgi:hypothetical protein
MYGNGKNSLRNMREYILTDKEREAIQRYLQNGVPNDFIHLIKHRAKANLEILQKDLELLNSLVKVPS